MIFMKRKIATPPGGRSSSDTAGKTQKKECPLKFGLILQCNFFLCEFFCTFQIFSFTLSLHLYKATATVCCLGSNSSPAWLMVMLDNDCDDLYIMEKISPLSDPPFSIFHKKITKKIKKIIFFFLSKNLGSFASPTKGMNTFHYEMSKKWIFTSMNFQKVYWHGKTHSAMVHLKK